MNPILDGVRGLPLHPLVVHGAVVLLPLSALVLVLVTLVPPLRRRLGVLTPLLALLAAALVPIAIASGEVLMGMVGPTPMVLEHERLARMLPPWAFAMALVALAHWAWFRLRPAADASRRSARAREVDAAQGEAGAARGEASAGQGEVAAGRVLPRRAGDRDTEEVRPAAHPHPASRTRSARGSRAVGLLLGLAAIVTASGTVTLVVLIGEAGARSVWGG